MELHDPFIITARLLPGLKVGGAFISMEHAGVNREGRSVYQYFIDMPDGTEYSARDLKSGLGGGSLQSMFASLLSFLSACAESRQYGTRTGSPGENADLFPDNVGQWAETNSDELGMLQCEIEEATEALIVE